MSLSLDQHYRAYDLSSEDRRKIFYTFGSAAPLAERHFDLATVPGQPQWWHRFVGALQYCPLIGAPIGLAEYLMDCYGYLMPSQSLSHREIRSYDPGDTVPVKALCAARMTELRPGEVVLPGYREMDEDVIKKNMCIKQAQYARTGREFLKILDCCSAPRSALHLAIQYEREDFVEAVLDSPYGMQVLNRGNAGGATPIVCAVIKASLIVDSQQAARMHRLVEKVLAFNPDLNRINIVWNSALQVTAELGNFALSKRLLWLGGTLSKPDELRDVEWALLATARQELVEELAHEIAKVKWVVQDLRSLIIGYVL